MVNSNTTRIIMAGLITGFTLRILLNTIGLGRFLKQEVIMEIIIILVCLLMLIHAFETRNQVKQLLESIDKHS